MKSTHPRLGWLSLILFLAGVVAVSRTHAHSITLASGRTNTIVTPNTYLSRVVGDKVSPKKPQPTPDNRTPESRKLENIRNILRDIEYETNVKSAVIYVCFTQAKASSDSPSPPSVKPKDTEKPFQDKDIHEQCLQQAEELKLGEGKQSLPAGKPGDNEQLQLLLISSTEQLIYSSHEKVTQQNLQKAGRGFTDGVKNPEGRNEELYNQRNQLLYNLIVKPLETDLQRKGIKNLVFIVNRAIESIPFAALRDAQKNFLVERYSISLMPSFDFFNTPDSDIKTAGLLLMGASTFADINHDPLPNVEHELHTIKDLWKGQSSQPFLNETFTISNLKSQHATGNFRIIHLATHAKVQSGNSRNSYIQFWGDEQLTLKQFEQLQLDEPPVDLLVLSACETSKGNNQAILGFAGAALKVGVKSVLASHWATNDLGTTALMAEFYQQLNTAPIKAEALRQAQLAMLRKQVRVEENKLISSKQKVLLELKSPLLETPDFSEPKYWAQFTLVGSPW